MKAPSETGRAKRERARRILHDLGVIQHGRPSNVVQRALVADWLSMREQLDRLRSQRMGRKAHQAEARLIALAGKTLERLQATRKHR